MQGVIVSIAGDSRPRQHNQCLHNAADRRTPAMNIFWGLFLASTKLLRMKTRRVFIAEVVLMEFPVNSAALSDNLTGVFCWIMVICYGLVLYLNGQFEWTLWNNLQFLIVLDFNWITCKTFFIYIIDKSSLRTLMWWISNCQCRCTVSE